MLFRSSSAHAKSSQSSLDSPEAKAGSASSKHGDGWMDKFFGYLFPPEKTGSPSLKTGAN